MTTKSVQPQQQKPQHPDTIGGIPINEYKAKWYRDHVRKERINNGLSKYVHAWDIPNDEKDDIVKMRDQDGLSWSRIAQRFNLSVYIIQQAYHSHKQTHNQVIKPTN